MLYRGPDDLVDAPEEAFEDVIPPAEVVAFDLHQTSTMFHPLTCESGHVLTASLKGYLCPACGYRQGWRLKRTSGGTDV